MTYLLASDTAHGIDPSQPDPVMLKTAAWTLGIFLVVLFVLKKMAIGPIVAGLQAREDRINASLKQAAEIEVATRELSETNRKALEEAQRQAQQIVADARDSGKRAAQEIVDKANAEIEAQRERFQREVRLEIEKARASIRQDAVDLTLDATARLMGRMLTSGDQRRLVEEALSDAEKAARN